MHWDIDPVIFPIGQIELRWYGLFFATGLLLCAWMGPRYFEKWGLPRQHAESLTLWVPVGMLLGAHYIHLIFYEWDGLFDLRFEIESLWPPRATLGRFWALGSGLASHGGGLGCVLALLLFWYLRGRPLGLRFHRYADAVMVTSVWVYPWVRIGNFFNSEILGRPTDMPWGVVFDRLRETEPRHPVVLYEAAMYFAELGFAIWMQERYARKLRPGTMFYLLLMTHFSLRFVAEFFKDSQHVDEGWALNMGHLLSLPIIAVCAFLIFGTKRFSILTPLTAEEKDEIEGSVVASRREEVRLEAIAEAKRKKEDPAKAAEAALDALDAKGSSEGDEAAPRKKKSGKKKPKRASS